MAVPSAMVRTIMVVVLYSFLNKIGSFAIARPSQRGEARRQFSVGDDMVRQVAGG